MLLLLGLTVVLGGGKLIAQRRETVQLRAERDRGRHELREWERVVAENSRLRERQIPVAELETLRADRAALPRLRAELDALARATPDARP